MGRRFPYEAFPADSVDKPAQSLTPAELEQLKEILAGSESATK